MFDRLLISKVHLVTKNQIKERRQTLVCEFNRDKELELNTNKKEKKLNNIHKCDKMLKKRKG